MGCAPVPGGSEAGEPPAGRPVVIANPEARSGGMRRRMRRLQRLDPEALVWPTRHAGHARELARLAADGGASVVVAAGGDGTVHEVANGLMEARRAAPLGLLPLGTMNVLAREMGIPLRGLEAAWQAIQAGPRVEIDCFRAGAEHLVQMGGIGLDAAVVRQTSRHWKRWLGPLSYILKGVELVHRPPVPLRLFASDGRQVDGVAALLGNGRYYGGSMTFFPRASNRDGLLDVLVFREQSWPALLAVLDRVVRCKPFPEDRVEYLQTRHLRVEAPEPVPYELDGEWRGETPVDLCAAARRLSICVPPGSAAATEA